MKYEILEHLADLKIKAFGKTKKELFLNLLFGMSKCLEPLKEKKGGKIKRKIKIKSSDLNSLLVDFLNEVLYLSQINQEIYFGGKIKNFSETEIEGELIGQKVARFNEDIKAATYHNLEICRDKNNLWQATVLFDI